MFRPLFRQPPVPGQRPASEGDEVIRIANELHDQLLEGYDAAVDGITEGAGLGPGLGHADQVRNDEAVDVLGAEGRPRHTAQCFQVDALPPVS